MKKWISFFAFCCLIAAAQAQVDGYRFYGRLDSVSATGFYNIPITPALTKFIKTDFSDLRIINKENKWVPHLVRAEMNAETPLQGNNIVSFEVTTNGPEKSALIVHGNKQLLNNLEIRIKAAVAERHFTLAGSDDSLHWFAINDSIRMQPWHLDDAASSIFRFYFPAVNYRLYRITIHNNGKDPYNVQQVTTLPTGNQPPNTVRYEKNPPTSVAQKDSAGESVIQVKQAAHFHFDSISLVIDGPAFYQRQARLWIPDDSNSVYHHGITGGQYFEISGNKTNGLQTNRLNPKTFYLVIQNDDNLPVKIRAVDTYAQGHFITTYLEAGQSYRLIAGNASATYPNYDMQQGNESIPVVNSTIALYDLQQLDTTDSEATTESWQNVWLWVIIILVLALLSYVAIKMTGEIKKKQENDRI